MRSAYTQHIGANWLSDWFHALSPLVASVSRGLCLCDIGYGHDHHRLYDPHHLEMGTRFRDS